MAENISEDLKSEVKSIVDKIRELAETKGIDSAEYKRYVENSDVKMAEFDKKNDELVQKLETERKNVEEMKERVIHLEALASGAFNGGGNDISAKDASQVMNALLKNSWTAFIGDGKNEAKARKVFDAMSKNNYHDVDGAQKMVNFLNQIKAAPDLLRSDIGELGGFLCPPEYASELDRTMTEYSPIRKYARVKKTASKTYKQPVRTGIPVASRPGEAGSSEKTTSIYTLEDFSPTRLTNTVPVTLDELAFNGYDLASELVKDNSEAFAVKEGQEFVTGTGIAQGLGFAVDPNVPQLSTATSTLTFDDIINMTGELKSGYNPMYLFNRRTLAYLRTIKDQNDRYLWSGPFGDAATGSPATINGYRYSSEFIDMDDYDVDNGFPILFADMLRFYQIVDRTDITIIRDEYSKKVEGIVEYTMNKWCVGKPLIKEAGIRLKKIA